ncbi:AbrB/MazE/SpoVT family DNA-binding domain-containing protein [Candidatus Bathyarchaeota archaeon]|nr:AbrB/MazE/SpoVT family DNA-binding domain-containing protein [Candidatus Bathyarchaeota archaeon]
MVPKVFREAMGIEPGDEIAMEIREGELSIRPVMDPESFIEDFCSIPKERLTRKIDIKKILEEEVEERLV